MEAVADVIAIGLWIFLVAVAFVTADSISPEDSYHKWL